MKKILITMMLAVVCLLNFEINVETTYAKTSNVAFNLTSSDGQGTGTLTDTNRQTCIHFAAGTKLTMTSTDKIYGIYIEWQHDPTDYTITYNGKTVKCDPNHFFHEYIEIDGGASSVVFNFTTANTMAEIYAYAKDATPADVQRWMAPCSNADMLVVSTHSDDEILFLGGALAEYAGEQQLKVQLAYFFDYTTIWNERQHERLDGLWTIGVRYYPDIAPFKEPRGNDPADPTVMYGDENGMKWAVELMRKYKPKVVVTQDEKGEYGQVQHLFVVDKIKRAVCVSGDPNKYPESAQKYGAWDVPKTYLHLYKVNKIQLNTSKPLSNFGGKTAFDMAKLAYLCHATQQQYWFSVSQSESAYGIPFFGLYRTTVGTDEHNDMMEHVNNTPGNPVIAGVVTEPVVPPTQATTAEPTTEATTEIASDENASSEISTQISTETINSGEVTDSNTGLTLPIILTIIAIIAVAGLLVFAVFKMSQNR